jgi:serine/threonine protein kinase
MALDCDENEWNREIATAGGGTDFCDRYAVLNDQKPLGEGTFGQVFLCRRRRTGPCADKGSTNRQRNNFRSGDAAAGGSEEQRAAKVVRKARLQTEELRCLIGEDGEVKTHQAMRHKHIVTLFEYFDEPMTVTLVLEYCAGGDLFDAIIGQRKVGQRGLTEQAAAVATRHLLSALAYMHKQKVVHRDIKCENVLLRSLGVPLEENIYKLCDFGFAARTNGDANSLYARIGSPNTVAPEVVAGKGYGVAVDVWSTGAVLYMMLSATAPFLWQHRQ